MDQHLELQGYDSTPSETVAGTLCAQHAAHAAATFDVYFLLLAVLWNERAASRRSQCSSVQHVVAAASGPYLQRQSQEASCGVYVCLSLFVSFRFLDVFGFRVSGCLLTLRYQVGSCASTCVCGGVIR